MSNRTFTVRPQSFAVVFAALLVLLAVGCGGELTGGQSAVDANNSPVPAASTSPDAATGSGLDEACVQRVLGRAVTEFSDVSPAERDAIFQQCSGDQQQQRQRQLGTAVGGNVLDAIDQACVTRVTGQDELDLARLSLEQRQGLFEECLPDGLEGLRGGVGGRPIGVNEELQECLADALGSPEPNLFDLTEEQRSALATACGDLIPDRFEQGALEGGFQGFGGAQRGPDGFLGGRPEGRGGGGGFFGLDLTSDCVRDVLGRDVAGPGDVTRDEIQRVFAQCSTAQAP